MMKMDRKARSHVALTLLLCSAAIGSHPVNGYAYLPRLPTIFGRTTSTELHATPRYGPPSSNPYEESEDGKPTEMEVLKQKAKAEKDKRMSDFRAFLDTALATEDPTHLPQVMARNVETILSLKGEDGAEILKQVLEESKDNEDFPRTIEIMESIMSFTEDFVEQAETMDMQNKKLLGKIINTMRDKESGGNREELLDKLIAKEKENFTPGFLRHLDGECERIAGAPKMTPESVRLLEIIRIIQTRVLEELGKDLGEGAIVLGQLMAYEKIEEMNGVLEAGLMVRGVSFAHEMKALTEEALEGFTQVRGEVDSELVERVEIVDKKLQEYLDTNDTLQ
uniref:Uncharacterized protein n=1 Tax=Craspedostauros australis TaxID=1486917 RepID=A0A7R9ZLG0_9STRA|mmetsp:Transcript_17151/g.47495  ORF Transcript_17151/g.47495 Transcript_17151/m.47495 type:complete len:337 (+) Transcript_17151:178-1188(+)|eukprot:CAMPEP_0198127142 /NCGR_PEP_ID=MMETSP1442-20131203/46524_1 /TAXON_ID= /ORGANISM="Craspedostauros australis, Strain CCMP3328" /LENGTH=336 /DNA_ID=CAMNT_0043787071 /DNA_START=116 /DNA_END=1126 /DNA_ORIENTATION=-